MFEHTFFFLTKLDIQFVQSKLVAMIEVLGHRIYTDEHPYPLEFQTG